MVAVAERVDSLEYYMKELAYAQMRTEIELTRLSEEMREFKQEMADFKREMADFKSEMADFKGEMADFRDRSEANRIADRREWNQRWGELANRLGTVAEDIVAPNLPRIAQEYFGVETIVNSTVRRRVRNRTGDRTQEFDAILEGVTTEGETIVLLSETKSTARFEHIERFLGILAVLGDFLPEYADRRVIPVFASLSLDESLVNALTKRGIYAMAMGDETMELLNFEDVQAQEGTA